MKLDIQGSKLELRIKEQLRQFSIATGVGCFYVPRDMNGYHPKDCCLFCRTVTGVTGKSVDCHKALTYGAYQAERFSGKYIFYCPMGMAHFASPIFDDGRVLGVAIGGPVLLIEQDEYISEDLIDNLGIDACYTERLKEDLKSINQLLPERVTALSEMLFSICSFVSGADQLQYLSDEESMGNDISKYIDYINTMGGDNTANVYPIEKERELLALISAGDKEHSQKLLDEILCHIIAYSNNDFEKAKSRVLELVVLLSRAALEGGADVEQIFGLNYKYLSQVNSYKTVEELSNWLSNIMVRFTDCVFNIVNVKHVDTIYKAVDYIKRNYAKKITLEDVANYVFLSPSYFSKIFKEEVDVSFINYLNNIRIENSKRLLLKEELGMIEISEMTGFEDQSYFSKVFKKITGVTPGKYRQRHGKI